MKITDEEDSYPFAGYRKVLGSIYETVMNRPASIVLDIGFGTGILSARLYENGCTIYGQDFSEKMIEVASEKMPKAHLYQGDFTQGLVGPLKRQTYDFIVATYSLHHLDEKQKIIFLKELLDLLKAGGMILIGDVAFETREELDVCRRKAGDQWDDDEIYFVVEELKEIFPDLSFTRISDCAGILSLTREGAL